MLKRVLYNHWFLLTALSVALFLLNLGGYPLFDVDEPRYAETAREMLTSPGDWITPHFNWLTRFDKPALFYWLIAGMYKVFGVHAFSARLVSALAASSTMFLLYGLLRKERDDKTALITAIIFATMLQVYALGRLSVTDMTLSTFMTATWLFLYWACKQNTRWFLLAGVFTGLGVLTKGPVALALPGLTLLLYITLFARQYGRCLLSPWMYVGVFLCVAIAAPWYVWVAQANPQEFVGKFFFLHNLDRFATTVSGHSGPWYYYFIVIALGALPWVLFLPGAIKRFFSANQPPEPLRYYALTWFLVVFVFFSAAGTKLLTYVLPGFAALAILLGGYWSDILSPRFADLANPARMGMLKLVSRLLWVLIGVLCFIWVRLLLQPMLLVPDALQSLYQPWVVYIALAILLFGLSIAAFCLPRIALRKSAFVTLAVTIISLMIWANVTVFPMAANMLQSDVMAFAQRAVQDKQSMATYLFKKPSLVFYMQHKVYFVNHRTLKKQRSYAKRLKQKTTSLIKALHLTLPSLYLMVRNSDLHQLDRYVVYRVVQTGYVYSLVHVGPFYLKKDQNQ